MGRTLRWQGWTAGWRPVQATLQGRVPLRLIHASCRQLKARHRQRLQARRHAHQVRVTVHATHTLWVQDSTHCGRTPQGPVHAEVLKDRGTLACQVLTVGAAATAADVQAALTRLAAAGGLPLVWGTDNGPAYQAAEVEAYLAAHRVIHLRSQLHTPQDNGAAERGIGELKAEAQLGPGTHLTTPLEAAARLQAACGRLTRARRRGSQGYATSVELATRRPCGYVLVSRAEFYAQTTAAMKAAVHDRMTARARRRAEREAVFESLERVGLVTRTRGGGHPGSSKRKD